jgi:hypothetical protein
LVPCDAKPAVGQDTECCEIAAKVAGQLGGNLAVGAQGDRDCSLNPPVQLKLAQQTLIFAD